MSSAQLPQDFLATEVQAAYITFFYLKHLCRELFSKITFISSAVFYFSQNLQELKRRQKARFGPARNKEKLCTFSKLARLETTLAFENYLMTKSSFYIR